MFLLQGCQYNALFFVINTLLLLAALIAYELLSASRNSSQLRWAFYPIILTLLIGFAWSFLARLLGGR
ncbi:hypothetical protein AUJ69_03625 [Candidatus Woesearchaeota archaeon CG1_02_47_18]|nr:MAG: hypothetical protein AUJ69_03625 [Candidatus Woesearchaeota archaeon CG1_02_47_18]HII29578.1 hypothetical protein [Candidatus Woesearchaeota archaeon]